MVDLPSGKMKSREGTVVDADDLMVDMTQTAANISEELGKLEGYSDSEKQELYKMIGLGALKYYILKVDPKKRILFDPEESVDFQGQYRAVHPVYLRADPVHFTKGRRERSCRAGRSRNIGGLASQGKRAYQTATGLPRNRADGRRKISVPP